MVFIVFFKYLNLGYKWCFNGTYHICWFYALFVSLAQGENRGKSHTNEYGNRVSLCPCLLDICWYTKTSRKNRVGKIKFILYYFRNPRFFLLLLMILKHCDHH